MNIRRTVWFILIVLLSQQSVATVGIIASASHSTPANSVSCHKQYNHSASHFVQHCQDAPISSSQAILLSDHSDGHGNHCENCVSGCQSLVFLSINIQTIVGSSIESIGFNSPFVHSAPSDSLYRPPITV